MVQLGPKVPRSDTKDLAWLLRQIVNDIKIRQDRNKL